MNFLKVSYKKRVITTYCKRGGRFQMTSKLKYVV